MADRPSSGSTRGRGLPPEIQNHYNKITKSLDIATTRLKSSLSSHRQHLNENTRLILQSDIAKVEDILFSVDAFHSKYMSALPVYYGSDETRMIIEEGKRALFLPLVNSRSQKTARKRTPKASRPVETEAEVVFQPDPSPPVPPAIADRKGTGFLPDHLAAAPVDLIGVGAEVQAFAKLAASRDIGPPLAVGVFGDWGSGKSFFMAGVRRKVEEFAQAARAATQDNGKEDSTHRGFHANIVQIEFNAWHYIESNLWASLVEFIFSKLEEWLRRENDGDKDKVGALFETLATSRQLKLDTARTVMSANAELAEAQKALADAEEMRAAKLRDQRNAAKAFMQAGLDALFSKENIDPIKNKLADAGLGKADQSKDDLAALLSDLKGEGGRARLIWRSLHGQLASGWGWAAIATLLLLPIAVPWVTGIISDALDLSLPRMAEIFAGFSAFAATLTAWGKHFLSCARPAIDATEAFVAKLEAKRAELEAQQLATEDQKLEAAQKALSEADKGLSAAQERLKQASVQAAEARNNYHAESARGRLNRFIRERLADGTYGKHLGLIATIRKDFEQLTNLMEAGQPNSADAEAYAAEEAAHKARVDALVVEAEKRSLLNAEDIASLNETNEAVLPPVTFERIVLYIDDLDRCPPEKVVEVLQAVHMLLSFRLFVVFVAVDARWVTQALQVVFDKQLQTGTSYTEASPLAASGAHDRATANDYMEKIFQIPYWVRPLDAASAGGFVAKLAEDFGVERIAPALAESAEVAVRSKALTTQTSPALASEKDNAVDDAASSLARAEKLKLVEADSLALAALAPTVGSSPRRMKRFFNTYLLIQTIVSVIVRGEVDGIDLGVQREFRDMIGGCSFEQQTLALATSLALAMQDDACPWTAKQVANSPKAGESSTGRSEIIKLPKSVRDVLDAFSRVRKADDVFPDGLENAFKLFMPIANRYGFRDAV